MIENSWKFIQYPGYMSDDVITFCGEDNIIREQRDSIGVTGYFLKNSTTEYTMFMNNWYIIKDINGNLGISPRRPGALG